MQSQSQNVAKGLLLSHEKKYLSLLDLGFFNQESDSAYKPWHWNCQQWFTDL